MGGKRKHCRWICWMVGIVLMPLGNAHGIAPKDLLDVRKLTKELRLSPAQQDSVARTIEKIRNIVEAYEWDYAKQKCEAILWKGQHASLEVLKERKKKAFAEVEAALKDFREGLGKDQQTRLDGTMKALDGVLDLGLNVKIPFHYIDTRPLFARLENQKEVAYTAFLDTPAPDSSSRYAAVLKAWTVRTYLSSSPGLADPNQMPGITEVPDLGIRSVNTPGQIKGKLVSSPLVVAATLMSPDLVESEVQHIHQYFNEETQDLETIRAAYRTQNRVGDAILIRLKLATPNAAAFLAPKNWIIYLEDSNGAGYEPIELREEVTRPIEAIKLEIPGNTYEVTDVFGNYYPYIPGEKTFLTEQTQRVTYVGNESFLKAFFPVRDTKGSPVIAPGVSWIKLVIRPAERDASPFPATAVWKFRNPPKP